MSRIEPAAARVVISDFGGVLTTPLHTTGPVFQERTGVPMQALGEAMARLEQRHGRNPLFELEMGELSEAEFVAMIVEELETEVGRTEGIERFGEIFFDALEPNEPMIAAMRDARAAGARMALLTNNVREWEPRWKSMLPVDEIFELVVDSAFVGMRKPDPAIYELTLRRLQEHDPVALGDLSFEECVFVDDMQVNIEAAAELGLQTVHFRENGQALAELRAALTPGD